MEGIPRAGSWKYRKTAGHGRACLWRAPTASGSEGGEQRVSSKDRLAGIGVDHNGQGNGFPDNPVPRIIVMNL